MKTIKKLFLILIMAVPIMVLGQDVTYTFDAGGNGEYNTGTSTWTSLTVAGGTATTTNAPGLTLSDNGTTNSTYVLKSTGTASPQNSCTVNFDAFTSTIDQQVVYKEYVNSVTFINKSGVVLRAQNTSSYGAGTKQGYFFRTTRAAGSGSTMGSITFTIYKIDASAATSLAASSAITITGYTLGSALYIKATAIGSTLTMYYSLNGTSWTQAVQKTGETTYPTAGGVQAYWGMGVSGVQPVYLDGVQYWDLSKNVTLSGSKFIYDGSTKSPTISKTGFTSPVETKTYTGISGTSYGPSSTAPSAVGTYYMTISEVEGGITRTANQVFNILSPTAFDKIYTFESDVVGSAAANTTASAGANVSAGHTVQLFTGATEGGYSVSTKTLSPNTTMTNGREISSLDYFGTTSTDYSVTWKEYNTSATANKHIVVLRADPTTSNSFYGVTNSTPQGQGYGFLINPTGASAVSLQIIKLNTLNSGALTSLSTVSLTPTAVQGVPLWFRASAIGSSSVALKLEYSTDGTNWSTATTATDASSPVASGATHIFGVNSNNQNYYFDYFGYVDLTKNVTANDNKFIYTGSALTPTISYPGFTSPSTTLTYTGTGATSYASSSTAPTTVGTYSLAVSATESGATRTGTFGFEIVPNTYDNIYTFKTDGVGNTPAGISFAQGATSGTGVVATYSGTDNGSSATALTFHPTGLGSVGNTGVADLTSFASSSSYSVTWKEYISGNNFKKGFLLQGQSGTNAYANDLKQGYMFIVYNDATNGTKCRIYTVGTNPVLTSTDNANGSVTNPASGVARWYRATVSYGLQKFEYSNNGTDWITATTTHDLTYAGMPGATQLVYGFGAGVGNYYYDYIASKTFTQLSTSGGNWSSNSWASTPGANTDIVLTSGELVVDNSQTVNSIVVSPGAKLTVNSGKTLTTSSLTLQSSSSGTATIVDADATGSVITAAVQQYLPNDRNWYVGIPFTDASAVNASTLISAGGASVMYWDEVTGAWVSNYSGALSRGKGYISVSGAGTSTNNISFSGTLNTGNIPVTVTRTVGATKEGFNLIANPYPSYLNPCAIITSSPNMEPTIWYRTKGTSYQFETVNTASGEGTNVSLTGTVTGYIPPMQAFWVRVKPNANPLLNNSETLTFTNAMRYHANPTVGQTTITTTAMKAPSATKSVTSKLRLVVSNGINSDEALIYTNDNAANSYDVYDSQKMTNANTAIPEIYTIVGNENLVINGLNSIQPNMEIPLGFTTGQSNLFTIKASEISNFDSGTSIILRDNLLQTEQELTATNAYSFSSDPASTTSRFSIIFKTNAVTTGTNSMSNNQSVNIYKNANNQIAVSCESNFNSTAVATIYNAQGQKLASKQLLNTKTVFENQFGSGVYMVSVNNGEKVTTSKIVLN